MSRYMSRCMSRCMFKLLNKKYIKLKFNFYNVKNWQKYIKLAKN